MVVKLGEHNNATKIDCQVHESTNRTICNDVPQEISVDRILVHPNCRPAPDWKNDIALLKLAEEPKLTSI